MKSFFARHDKLTFAVETGESETKVGISATPGSSPSHFTLAAKSGTASVAIDEAEAQLFSRFEDKCGKTLSKLYSEICSGGFEPLRYARFDFTPVYHPQNKQEIFRYSLRTEVIEGGIDEVHWWFNWADSIEECMALAISHARNYDPNDTGGFDDDE